MVAPYRPTLSLARTNRLYVPEVCGVITGLTVEPVTSADQVGVVDGRYSYDTLLVSPDAGANVKVALCPGPPAGTQPVVVHAVYGAPSVTTGAFGAVGSTLK